MRAIEVDRQPSSATRQALADFIDAVSGDLGARPVSDHAWLALTSDPAPPLATVIARQTATGGRSTIAAAAIVTRTNDGQMLEVVTATDAPDRVTLTADVGETACDLAIEAGDNLTWWIDDAPDEVLSAAAAHGLVPDRLLHQMRRPLPAEWRSSVATRGFRPGVDDSAWLAVNNRAFASHPEQGGWTPELLASRMAETWFDPDGFRLYEVGGQLAGFCWTKVHGDGPGRIGEIYVIGIDPSHQGAGLGRQLTLAGLDWLVDHGAGEAMLYVDGANTAAVETYRRLGFGIARTRTGLTWRSAVAH